MVWQVPGSQPITAPIANELRGKSVRQRLTEIGVPDYKRLQIPLENAHSLGRISDVLRDLAASLALQSRCPEGDEFKALQSAFWEIDAANRRISAILKVRKTTRTGGSGND